MISDRFIAHAGGQIAGYRYTNSLDAILNAKTFFSLIECDVVMGANGALVAHDGLEKNYSLSRPFLEVDTEEFINLRYLGKFRTASIERLSGSEEFSAQKFVLDIKGDSAEFETTCKAVKNQCDPRGLNRFVIQAYCLEDARVAISCGFTKIIPTFWKNYHDPFSEAALRFLRGATEIAGINIVGVSVNFNHLIGADVDLDDPAIEAMKASGSQVYLHGFDKDSDTARAVAMGFGLYTHLPFGF